MAENTELLQLVKKRMFQAMKEKDVVQKEILRTAIGEVTSTGEEATDDRVRTVLRKLVKSNRETLAATSDESQSEVLHQEIVVLETFLPKALTVEQIVKALQEVSESISSAKADGPAMGIAMKVLKANNAEVASGDVKQAIAQLRAPQ